jgi:predicted nucleic acid-binding protein
MTTRENDMTIFLDSNIVLYSFGSDDAKKAVAIALLNGCPHISIQVLNECSHVLRRKSQWPPAQIATELETLLRLVRLNENGLGQVRSAWTLAERYGYSHYDSLIIASALAADCSTLYTEDMQDGQVIAGRLTLTNPFRASVKP